MSNEQIHRIASEWQDNSALADLRQRFKRLGETTIAERLTRGNNFARISDALKEAVERNWRPAEFSSPAFEQLRERMASLTAPQTLR